MTARLLLGAALAAATVTVGCGGNSDAAERLPARLAAELAALSEEVARSLERGDPCVADDAAARLQRTATRAIESGAVAPSLARELRRAVTALDRLVACPDRASEPATAAPDGRASDRVREGERDDRDDRDEDENDDEGKGKSEGKGKGRSRGR